MLMNLLIFSNSFFVTESNFGNHYDPIVFLYVLYHSRRTPRNVHDNETKIDFDLISQDKIEKRENLRGK